MVRFTSKVRRLAIARMTTAFVSACGSSAPPPETPVVETPKEPVRPPPSKMRMSSELGVIDKAATARVFQGLDRKFDQCEAEGRRRVEVLAGEIKFFVRVNADGTPKYAFLPESTVGDHETEICFIDAVMAAKFPAPDGGEAEVTYSTTLKSAPGRPPNAWAAEKISSAIAKAEHCKSGSSRTFYVTVYVADKPGPGKEGQVQAVGVSQPDRESESQVECIIKSLKSAKVPTPGAWPAKVSFTL